MTRDIDTRLAAALHRIAVAHVPDDVHRDAVRTDQQSFTKNDPAAAIRPADLPDTPNRRLLVGAAAGILVVAGIGALLVLAPQNDNPAAPAPSATPEDTPLADRPLGDTNVAPGVGQWLDLPSAPDGMSLVAGKPFEVSPLCDQIESTINGPICVAISGSAQVAYANQSLTVIEVTTLFDTDTLDDYITALVDGYPDPYQDQTVTVRGYPGRLLTGGARLIAWQERAGVIGQVRIVDDTENTDLVASPTV